MDFLHSLELKRESVYYVIKTDDHKAERLGDIQVSFVFQLL